MSELTLENEKEIKKMKKLEEMKKRIKKNNKGFTLVELIIVVAIIAILAAVFAPMYTGYLEDARKTNDIRMGESLMQAASTAIVDPDLGTPAKSYTVKIDFTSGTAGTPSITGADSADATKFQEILNSIMTLSELKVESADAKGVLEFTIDSETGKITLTKNASDNWATLLDMKKATS